MEIYQKDSKGRVLVLGGRRYDLWLVFHKISGHHFEIGDVICNNDQEAIEAYMIANSSPGYGGGYAPDYLTKWFWPNYNKLKKNVRSIMVPSQSNPSEMHEVTINDLGEVKCDAKCPRFRYKNTCRHVEFVRDLLNLPSEEKDSE